MNTINIGDRVFLKNRLELPNLEIENHKVLIVEKIDNSLVTCRYGRKDNQLFNTNILNLKPFNKSQIKTLDKKKSLVACNLNVGTKGKLHDQDFEVSNITFSSSIYEDIFEIVIDNKIKTITGKELNFYKDKIQLYNEKGENNMTQDLKNQLMKNVSEDEFRKILSSAINSYNDEIGSYLANERGIYNDIFKEISKPEKNIFKNLNKPVEKPKASEDRSQKVKFEDRPMNMSITKLKIDNVDIEFLSNGEIRVPKITTSNLSETIDVLQKVNTILKLKGDK